MSESDSSECLSDSPINKTVSFVNLSEDETSIRYVYHMSDIHIRKNSVRKEEYLEVFKNAYAIIKKEIGNKGNQSLIVLTGDILHAKTDLCPDSILMTNNFLRSLTLMAPVILIPGNHDCNLSNRQRLDSLSPIIKDIGNLPNIFYLKNSGFYRYNNIIFGVTSIFDQSLLPVSKLSKSQLKKMDYDDVYKIALYHGQVHSAETDVGYRMNNNELLVKDFDGYDYVMLGDIHKFQYLNDEKTVAYAGSLIQQSHGEKIKGHGILKWDLKRSESNLIEVPNSYGYCTIRLTDGKIDNHIIPPKPRIRFILENTNQIEYQDIVKKLEKSHQIQEIIKESDLKMISRLGSDQISKVSSDKIRKVGSDSPTKSSGPRANMEAYDTQERIFREFLAKKKIDNEQINSIIALHGQIYQEAVAEKKGDEESDSISKKNGVKWKILELKFSNTLSYGKNNVVDFRGFDQNQIIGISAPNRYGKTAIIDIILFCLFDKMSRGERRDILNVNETAMSCSLLFSVGSITYLIERNGRKNGQNVTIDVSFYKIRDDQTRKCLNGIDKNETNKKIAKLIGDYDDYMTTCFYLQMHKNNNFIDMTHLRKKEYLNDILKLNVFEDCHRIARDKMKEIDGELRALTQIAGTTSVTDLIETLKQTKASLQRKVLNLETVEGLILPSIRSDIESQRQSLNLFKIPELNEYDLNTDEDFDGIIQGLNNKLKNMNIVNINNIKEELAELTARSELVIKKIKDLDSYETLKSLRAEADSLRKEIVYIPPDFSKMDKKKILDEINEYDFRINEINLLIEKYPADLNEKLDMIEGLKKHVESLKKSLSHKQDRRCEMNELIKKNADLVKQLEELINLSGSIGVNTEEIIRYKDPFREILQSHVNLFNKINMDKMPSEVKEVYESESNWISQYDAWKEKVKNSSSMSRSAYEKKIEHVSKKISATDDDIDLILSDYVEHLSDQQILRSIKKAEREIEGFSEYNGSKKARDLLINEIDLINRKKDIADSNLKLIKKYAGASEKNAHLNSKIAELKERMEQIDTTHQALEKEREVIQSKISKYTEKISLNEEKIKKHDKISHHLSLLAANRDKYSFDRVESVLLEELVDHERSYVNQVNQLKIDIETLRGQLAAADKSYSAYLSIRDKFDTVSKESNLYQLYHQATDYNGLPYEILKGYLPLIGNDINQILHSMVDFDIEFVFYDEETQTKGKSRKAAVDDKLKSTAKVLAGAVNINICPPGLRPHNISLGSQFEKFIVGLAIRMTFGHISLTAKPNFLIIDEGFASLDKEYKAEIPKILAYIKNQYEHVIIISHLEELKEQYDHIVDIHRINERSYVNTQRKVTVEKGGSTKAISGKKLKK